jgi:hypothetical protein
MAQVEMYLPSPEFKSQYWQKESVMHLIYIVVCNNILIFLLLVLHHFYECTLTCLLSCCCVLTIINYSATDIKAIFSV